MKEVPEIEVTSAMVDAGLQELYEFRLGDDPRYLLECIYRAMHYVRLDASSTSANRYLAASEATE